MAAKRSSNTKAPSTSETDEFKLIKGINTMIENRLHTSGIQTFEQLAGLSPSELMKRVGKMTGVNIDRIKDQDWVGQARALAGQHTQLSSGKEFENVGFVVDLFLDTKKKVRLTQVLNVKSGVGDTWECWDETRLFDFFVEQSRMNLIMLEPPISSPVSVNTHLTPVAAEGITTPITFPTSATAPPSPPVVDANTTDVSTLSDSPSDPILRELQMVSSETLLPTNQLKSGEPYCVGLELNLTDQLKQKKTPLIYTASVYAKRWDDQSRYVLGEAHGRINTTEDRIDVEGQQKDLKPGVYSLTASLVVTESGKDSKPHLVAHSSLVNRMFHIN